MRIWYVVDTFEYWLEPDFFAAKDGRLRIYGARLYSTEGKFKGYWHYQDWPLVVKRDVRTALNADIKRRQRVERLERVRTRSMIGKTK